MKYFECKNGILTSRNLRLFIINNQGVIDYKIKSESTIYKGKKEIETKKSFAENIDITVFKFSDWVNKSNYELLLFRQIVFDSILIVDYFEDSIRKVFVKSLIKFLQSFNHFDPIFKEKLKELTKKYFDLLNDKENLKSIQKEEQSTEQLFAAEQYLELCMDDKNNDWFDLNTKIEDRETEVEEIATFLTKYKEENQNADIEKLDLLLQKARTWLMKRYDIDKAAEIQFHQNKTDKRIYQILPELIGFIILFSLLTINMPFWSSFNLPQVDFYNLKFSNYGLLALYVIVFMFAIRLFKNIDPGKNQIQIFMPRVVAGIIVGYFAIMVEEMWLGLFSKKMMITNPESGFEWLFFAVRILIPLITIYFYLLIEMSNVQGINKIKSKAARILFRGYAYSLIIGVFISEIFGENLVRLVYDKNGHFEHIFFKGIFGNIYPEAVLLLSPLALFIGIFLQLLWEDKAITEKI